MKYLKRHLYYSIKKYINHKNAILITGARQTGKTTLLKLIFNELPKTQKAWFDFENPFDVKFFEEIDYSAIERKLTLKTTASGKIRYIFIDEIQNFPEITKIMKYLIDHYHIKFFVTGSVSFYIRNLFPESMAGRKFEFHLSPLTFVEFLYFKKRIKSLAKEKKLDTKQKSEFDYELYAQDYQEYKQFGGLPEVALASSIEEKQDIIKNIVKSYFEKDVIRFGHFSEIHHMRNLIPLLARRIGSKVDITKISQELSVSRKTTYDYLYFLETTFFISLISPYSKSVDRRVAGGKKLYFIDNGIANYLTSLNQGQLLENAVYNQLKHYGNINYYQTQKGKEIDFILDKNHAFEVKKKATSSDLTTLKRLSKSLVIKNYHIISEEFAKDVRSVLYPQCL